MGKFLKIAAIVLGVIVALHTLAAGGIYLYNSVKASEKEQRDAQERERGITQEDTPEVR